MRVGFQFFREHDPLIIPEVRSQCRIWFRFKLINLLLSLNEESQRWCLHASDRKQRLMFNRESPGSVHADDPVCFRTASGRLVQVIVVSSWTQAVETLTDSLVCHGTDPQALEVLLTPGHDINITEDKFALTPGICSADYR